MPTDGSGATLTEAQRALRRDAREQVQPELVVRLPLPVRYLHQNSRVHWRVRSQATKEARFEACIAAQRAMTSDTPNRVLAACRVRVTFHFPDRRRRDVANYLAACKAYFDGFTDARVWTDDSVVTHWETSAAIDSMRPHVEIEVWEAA